MRRNCMRTDEREMKVRDLLCFHRTFCILLLRRIDHPRAFRPLSALYDYDFRQSLDRLPRVSSRHMSNDSFHVEVRA